MTDVTVKKAFVELYEILQANSNKKVSTVLPQLLEVMTSKGGGGVGKTFKKDEDGNVTHMFCYYHKEWEDVTEHEYGKKANTATGLNTMCKDGVSKWTKQQREAKKAKEQLLEAVANGEVPADELNDRLSEIEEMRSQIN